VPSQAEPAADSFRHPEPAARRRPLIGGLMGLGVGQSGTPAIRSGASSASLSSLFRSRQPASADQAPATEGTASVEVALDLAASPSPDGLRARKQHERYGRRRDAAITFRCAPRTLFLAALLALQCCTSIAPSAGGLPPEVPAGSRRLGARRRKKGGLTEEDTRWRVRQVLDEPSPISSPRGS
jgi:hypothetical protein